MRTNVATTTGTPDQRHADDTHPVVHVHAGAHTADPLVQLHMDAGVVVRVTLTLAQAQRLARDLDRAIAFHTAPATVRAGR